MQYTDDPISDFFAWDKERQDWLDSLPKCSRCGKPIQDGYYFAFEDSDFEEEIVCDDCLYEYCWERFRVTSG